MIGPKGMAFDNDEVLDDNDDEDLKNDPVSQLDMQVSNKSILGFSAIFDWHTFKTLLLSFLRECASHNTNDFGLLVDQLSPEEMLVTRQAVNDGN